MTDYKTEEQKLKEYMEKNFPEAINYVLIFDNSNKSIVRIGKEGYQNEGMIRALIDGLNNLRIAQYIIEAMRSEK